MDFEVIVIDLLDINGVGVNNYGCLPNQGIAIYLGMFKNQPFAINMYARCKKSNSTKVPGFLNKTTIFRQNTKKTLI